VQLAWEARQKVAAAKGYPPRSVDTISRLTNDQRRKLKESVAVVWAFFELGALQGKHTNTEVTESMAAILAGICHEDSLLSEISARVDELLQEMR
jgi:hypothetical protein